MVLPGLPPSSANQLHWTGGFDDDRVIAYCQRVLSGELTLANVKDLVDTEKLNLYIVQVAEVVCIFLNDFFSLFIFSNRI